MSLINDMLRDLDARRGHTAAGAPAMLPVARYPTGLTTAKARRRLAMLFALPLLAAGLPILTDSLAVFDWNGPGSAAVTARLAIPAPAARPVRHQPASLSGSRTLGTAGPTAAAAPPTAAAGPDEPVRTNSAVTPPVPDVTAGSGTGDIIVQRHDAGHAWRLAAETAANGQVEQAIGQLEDILANQDDHHQARLLLARLLAGREQPGRAETVLREGLAGHPLHAPYAQLLARLLGERGQHKEAIAWLEAALPGAGRNAGYRALLAGLYRQAGEPAAAVNHYSAALTLAPDHGQWWTGLGIAEEQSGNRAGAISAYRRSLQYPLAPALRDYARERLQLLAEPAGIAKSEPAGKT